MSGKLIFLSFLLILFPSLMQSQEKVWINGESSIVLEGSLTIDDAKQKALDQALADACIKGAGVDVKNMLFILQSSDDPETKAMEYTKSSVSARILQMNEPVWKDTLIKVANDYLHMLKVNVRVRVEKNVRKDPSFILYAQLNSENFREGEELNIRVKSTKDCYLTILNFAADNKIYTLLPNKKVKDNSIRADSLYSFPDDFSIKGAISKKFKLYLPGGKNHCNEIIKIIATKNKYPIWGLFEENTDFEYQYIGDYEKFIKWLAKIPADEIAEFYLPYNIFK